MSRHPQLYQWVDTVVMRFPSLSKPQALRLAWLLDGATWLLLSVGGEAEAQADEQLDIKDPSVPDAVRRRGKRWRIVGIFLHGWSLIIAALLRNRLLPRQTWPTGSMAQAAR